MGREKKKGGHSHKEKGAGDRPRWAGAGAEGGLLWAQPGSVSGKGRPEEDGFRKKADRKSVV